MAGPVITTLLATNPASGNVTTDGTEQELTAGAAVSGTFMLRLDTSNMADGDQIELRLYTKAGSTRRQAACYSLSNAQQDPVHLGPILPTAEDYRATIKRVAGTDRSYAWSILNLNGT
ncbi:MAG TPA: hypothetical protein VEC60_18820 [Reyranella sp.]|nr:hypothetical protein [Reyranella sp.]